MNPGKAYLNEEAINILVKDLAEQVSRVRGVKAVVLGGSRARGTHHPGSDIDLGIYYHPQEPLDIPALTELAMRIDDEHRPDLLTMPGGWGPWINGGGWLTVQGTPVDFLYRDVVQVETCIKECLSGRVEISYQPGHPFGFLNSIYLAETAVCRILCEAPSAGLSRLKQLAAPYPPALKSALIEKFAWEINFSLGIAAKGIQRRDVTYISGCLFRAAGCMMQVLFALNRQYWLNEKGAAAILENQPIQPDRFRSRLEQAFSLLNSDPHNLDRSIYLMNELSAEITALVKLQIPPSPLP